MLSTAQPCGFATTTGARDAHAIYLDAASRITEKDSRFVRHYTLGIALYILILMELLTCCTPAFANTLYIGVPTEARVTFDGCDTLVEMRAIFEAAKVSRKEATRVARRYNQTMNSVGQPVCGLVTGRIIVLEVHDTTMVTQHDGTSLRLNLVTVQIVGSVARLVGIVNVPVVSGLSKIGTPI